MNYYQFELNQIKAKCYSNTRQLVVVTETKKYMDRHFDSCLSLDLLSNKIFISKYHLIRLFKKYYGCTPGQYLIDKRLQKAKEFLRAGQSISEVCYNVGFESPGSFATLFKRKTGKTPSIFQKEQFSINRFN